MRLAFADLRGWAEDDHAAALAAFLVTADLYQTGWNGADAADAGDARRFFEALFLPVLVGNPPALFTGYYEPEIAGALQPGAGFDHPLYTIPKDLPSDGPWYSRAEIERQGILAGYELVWLADPVDAFFAQVQGSARIRLRDGRVLRFGHSAKNGHAYRSIGAELVRRGDIAPEAMSAQTIRSWLADHPERLTETLWHNPSFVFFHRLDLPDEAGPLGAMGRPVTAMRSLAVDPDQMALGAPVWIEADGEVPIHRLMIAQDTGSAIKGPQRGDIYFGTGPEAGERAGRMKASGRMIALVPRSAAEGIGA